MNVAFLNTRPLGRNTHLLDPQFASAFCPEFYLPLLQLTPKPLDAQLKQQLAQLHQNDVIIAVSPMAVHTAFDYLNQCDYPQFDQLQHTPRWIAVGQKTVACLADYQIQADCPALETSEGMWQLPQLHTQQLKRVAFLRGEGGREWLMQQLQSQAIHVENIQLYQRSCPPHLIEDWQDLQTHCQHLQMLFVLISSGASWQYWQAIRASISYPIHYLVLGDRMAQQIRLQLHQHEHLSQISQLDRTQLTMTIQTALTKMGEIV